ncbi:hypothetical protein F5146DRAFT_999665 [Armillaria mellea]|nr:hypothetical protein F5146DRAFT_999665 [Armillaria mellea]
MDLKHIDPELIITAISSWGSPLSIFAMVFLLSRLFIYPLIPPFAPSRILSEDEPPRRTCGYRVVQLLHNYSGFMEIASETSGVFLVNGSKMRTNRLVSIPCTHVASMTWKSWVKTRRDQPDASKESHKLGRRLTNSSCAIIKPRCLLGYAPSTAEDYERVRRGFRYQEGPNLMLVTEKHEFSASGGTGLANWFESSQTWHGDYIW